MWNQDNRNSCKSPKIYSISWSWRWGIQTHLGTKNAMLYIKSRCLAGFLLKIWRITPMFKLYLNLLLNNHLIVCQLGFTSENGEWTIRKTCSLCLNPRAQNSKNLEKFTFGNFCRLARLGLQISQVWRFARLGLTTLLRHGLKNELFSCPAPVILLSQLSWLS